MNARLHDSVARTDEARNPFEEQLRADGLLFRKLVLLARRGDWTVHPNAEASADGKVTGPQPEDLTSFRAAVDRSNVTPVGRFACV